MPAHKSSSKSSRPLSHHFTTVTPLSKTIAFILFISLPFLGFFIGVKYGEMRAMTEEQENHISTYLQQAPTLTPHREF